MLTSSQTRIALGSPITLTLATDASVTQMDDFFRQLWLEIFTFEQRFSRFLPASELSQFNRSAGVRLAVSHEFSALLSAAKTMADMTGGLYNPFVLPALQRAGYIKSMVAAHSSDKVDDFTGRSVVAADRLEVGSDWASIPYGTAIDLGGCGKGYAGDLLAAQADKWPEVKGYWFSLGGDVIAHGHDENGESWIIQVEDTTHENSIIGECRTSGKHACAVATSSVLRRGGEQGGQRWHHIIDSTTGRPAETDIETASIAAPTLLEADVLATCAVVLGSEAAPDFVAARGASGVLLQRKQAPATFSGNLKPSADNKPPGE
jgi:thiamine biosynthesis lipoprotein